MGNEVDQKSSNPGPTNQLPFRHIGSLQTRLDDERKGRGAVTVIVSGLGGRGTLIGGVPTYLSNIHLMREPSHQQSHID